MLSCGFNTATIIWRKTRNVSPLISKKTNYIRCNKQSVHSDSLRVLEWDKLCNLVASFANSSPGREATKEQLWQLDLTFQDSLRLLDETNAAIEMHKHGSFCLDLTPVDLSLVTSAIHYAQRGFPLQPDQALAVARLLQFLETLQLTLKAVLKRDADYYKLFMPLTEMITEVVVNTSLLHLIEQVVDEDGFVKDSASSTLKRSRELVRNLERKLNQLMDSLIRSQKDEGSLLEVSNVDGRWCIKSTADRSIEGLLMSSGSGIGYVVEPLPAVQLNDELQQARASVAKAEEEVLLILSQKMQMDLDEIKKTLDCMIQLDVINARATYSLSYGGTCPDIYLPEDKVAYLTAEGNSLEKRSLKVSYMKKEDWLVSLPKAYHPLLLQRHRQTLKKAKKDVSDATAEIRRRKQNAATMRQERESDINLPSLKEQVTAIEQAQPVPVDFFISEKTRVLVITGPNTGGKTICLKTVGLTAIMAKSGLYVLASESARIPWFDSIFADIGDEQSLSQSLSTFSGHLKQISNIWSCSTSRSLVLLDEVGAGTNPLEGAALGMALLESFAGSGSLLTMATTHHGELKTLKYSNGAFENACMEFDEVNLRPTYKILWGIPGRSNAINIAERLGLPSIVANNARELYGAASAEINEVIVEMETLKQESQGHLYDSRHYLMLSKELIRNLSHAKRKILDHGISERHKMVQEISLAGAIARSTLHKKVREIQTSAERPPLSTGGGKTQPPAVSKNVDVATDRSKSPKTTSVSLATEVSKPSISENTEKRRKLPKVGEAVFITSLGRKATILKVEPSKEEIVVQAGNIKLKLNLNGV